MKKLALVLWIVVIFSAIGYAQGKEYTLGVDALFYDSTNSDILLKDAVGKPITGLLKHYYGSGKIESETPYKDGKAEGLKREYYESGKIKKEIPYKNDKAEGLAKEYYESGKIIAEIPVRNGKIEGHVKEYYENGSIKIEESYKNGKAEGIAKIYYENGKIKEEASFKNGKRYGLKFYFLNGAVIEVEYQNNSAASGVCISANGKRTPLTDSELIYLNKGEGVICQ